MLIYQKYGTRRGPLAGSPPNNLNASPDDSGASARSAQPAADDAAGADGGSGGGGGATTNFAAPDGTPHYYIYNVTYYNWDETNYVVVQTTGKQNISSYQNGDGTYDDTPPDDYPKPASELVQEIAVVPANPGEAQLLPLAGKRVRIYHDEPNNLGHVKVVVVNVLVLNQPTTANVPPTGTPGPGQVTFYAQAKDGQTPLGYAVDVRLLQRGTNAQNTTPLPPADTGWHPLTRNGTTATGTIDVALPGYYTYEVRVGDGQPNLPGNFTLAQTAAGVQYALAFNPAFTPHVSGTTTALGQATGKLTAHLVGGPGRVNLVVSQDGTFVTTAQSANLTSTSDVANVEITGLPAGDYTVRATLQADASKYVEEEGNVLPPDLDIGDQLTFLPWVQPTLLHAANNPGTSAPAAPAGQRPSVALGVRLAIGEQSPALETVSTANRAEIYGPGDVLGLSQRAILGTTPAPGLVGFAAGQLAAIEFKDEDLPWRYSTLQTATTPPEPLPWCMLLVLKEDGTEYARQPLAGEPLPSIKVLKASVFASDDPGQQKLWAHVQVNKSLGTPGATALAPPAAPTQPQITKFFNEDLPKSPDLAYARLFCPRRLEAATHYRAFLVPTIEAGRLAGLGLPFAPAQLTAPLARTAGQVLPVYYQWEFTTGSEADFEDLAGALHPVTTETATAAPPTLAVPVGSASYALPMPALLVNAAAPAPTPAAAQAEADDLLATGRYLYDQLAPAFSGTRAANGRPLVTPPLYGRAYFVAPGLEAPTTTIAPSWKHQLNLDPRYRALAALGAEVVRANQEDYVRRAWDQVQDILLANEKLRALQYGARTTAGLRDQHLPLNTVTTTTTTTGGQRLRASFRAAESAVAADPDGADGFAAAQADGGSPAPTTTTELADYALHLTALSLPRVRVSKATADASAPLAGLSLREAIRRSNVPLAAFSPTFRRIAKPFGNYMVGEVGRPLRPTQPEPAPDDQAPSLRQRGTSLRQRDALLSGLASGTVVAAPAHPDEARLYQFRDEVVDGLLKPDPRAAENPDAYLNPSGLSGAVLTNFNAAFRSFRVAQPAASPGAEQLVLGFRQLQRERPRLPLPEVKQDVHDGTQPGPGVQIKVAVVAPSLPPPPPPRAPGDFEAPHFDADDFYVGDVGETAPLRLPDWSPADFSAADFVVHSYRDYSAELPAPADTPGLTEDTPAPIEEEAAPAGRAFAAQRNALTASLNSVTTTTTTTAAGAVPSSPLPAIKQAKVFPVFKDPMSEPLCQRHPELFVPGLEAFPADGVAVLDVNHAFIEAYMVGLNHALGSELHWRGFPVELRGTFFQQFWNPGEVTAGTTVGKEDEAALLDIKPLDQWLYHELGTNALPPASGTAAPLRLALRSELLRRYPTLVLGLQPANQAGTGPDDDLTRLVLPHQRLSVADDLTVVAFDCPQAQVASYYLLLLERPGQPKFGLDDVLPPTSVRTLPNNGGTVVDDPLTWNDFSWPYLGTVPGATLALPATGKPRASAEPAAVAQLTNSAAVAYALFQEPILAAVPLAQVLP